MSGKSKTRKKERLIHWHFVFNGNESWWSGGRVRCGEREGSASFPKQRKKKLLSGIEKGCLFGTTNISIT